MRQSVAIFLLGLVGCGGQDPASWEPGRPRIDDLDFLEQEPGHPFDLRFQLKFQDSDSDLGAGFLELWIQGDARSSLELGEVFSRQVPPLSMDAQEGRMEVVVSIGTVGAGAELDIGFILEDGSGHRSNEPTIRLLAVAAKGEAT